MRRPPPARIGRYRIEHALGQGGLGEVHVAHDEELGRRIAIKLVRSDRVTPRQQQQLLQEARAMARLSSPYVVEVYDAGISEDRVFIAMELIEGQTLDVWCQAGKSVAEILRAFVAAGKGLLTAHRADLVHRDFKPSNVLVGRNGRAKVSDFGLAVVATREPAEKGDETRPSRAGTTAYMAPEQRAGGAVDERADQFAFCVALREALVGRDPPRSGWVRPRGRIPVRVHAAIRRGLHEDRSDRFESMVPLLRQLDPGRSLHLGLPGMLALGAVVSAGVWVLAGEGPGSRCEIGRALADAQWNERRAASLRADFVATQAGRAEDASERTARGLDRWLAAWHLSWDQVCASRASAEPIGARRLDCLDQRRREFAAFMTRLADPNIELVGRAAAAAARLPPPAECLDTRAEGAIAMVPEDKLDEVSALREELAQVHADDLAGRVTQGLARADLLVDRARALRFPPLLAEAEFRKGRLHERAGEYAAARGALEDAYYLSAETGQVRLQADASTMLVTVLGIRMQLPDQTAPWIGHALAAAERLGDPRRYAAVLVARAGLHAQRGELAEAQADYVEALQVQREAYGSGHPTLAATLNNLGTVAAAKGDMNSARDALGEAVAALEATYGPRHPNVAGALANLGAVEAHLGRDEAIETLERAREVTEATLGKRHPTLAPVLANLGRQHLAQGRADVAYPLFERALEIRRDALGSEHPEVGYAHVHVADAQRERGEFDAAREHYRRALAISSAGDGGIAWRAGYAHAGLGWIALAQGDAAAAMSSFDSALAIFGDAAPRADREAIESGLEQARP